MTLDYKFEFSRDFADLGGNLRGNND